MSIDIKICGLTNLVDAQVAVDCGADYLGFIFYERSPRAVSVETVASILQNLDTNVRAVGVFVNASSSFVQDAALRCGLAAVQLHGDEVPADFANFPVPIWRALSVSGEGCSPEVTEWPAERYLADAAAPGLYGGSGTLADWELAKNLATKYPLMLAGGLTPENVAAAIEKVHPLGVDVSSGVEASPGKKSHQAIRTFITNARQAAC